ncbi:long-chain-fatty-acid--CoA ligase [Sporosarcina sp. Marseille-Q4063]|uniref:class I adenylate-forming enzyme family protein n=1 Tax=Sporosarcina sp. Marseille-Q4063 TaxID=2810514 RepID=UPI001BB0AC21|nr:long-chain-fatty-acid--CoA ligase [Sporosarcina sp. Marseille-Q4063]QUW21963.1 long-chain-fatty-acid--CoA ligase [Sporosarcina sp. Marseille-Q4063]
MLTVGNMMKQNALKFKDKPAVIFQNKTNTYSELNERANQLANAFIERGYEKGDKVAVLMKNHAAYADIIVGLSKIGVVIVPMNYRLVGPEIEYILQNSDSRGLILTSEYVEEVSSLESVLPQLDTILVVGEKANDQMIGYEDFISEAKKHEPTISVSEDDIFYIGYTSGTTGKPKGVVISHRSRVLTGILAAYEYKIDESDVHLVAGPIYHAAPWIFLVAQLLVGGTVVIHENFYPEEVLAGIEKYKITNAFLAPTMYNFIVNVSEGVKAKYDLSSIRVLISAGSPLATKSKQDILSFFKNSDLHEFYGSTESAVTLNIKPPDINNKERSVGRPFPLVECLILDDNKESVKPGEIGELYFKGPYLLDEYYKNPEETAASFYGDYFSVGDMAMQDEEGFYYIVDRKKDMLISGGVNIYPRDIEEVLYNHPEILDVAVIGVPDPIWGEAVMAIVVPREGATLTEEEIIQFCDGKIASYKKPKSVTFLQELPRNPSGKILKNSLRDSYWEKEEGKI